MKLDAERGRGSFSRLREKAGDEGAACWLPPSPQPSPALRERGYCVSCVAEGAQRHGEH